jgi:hypothetical protein
LDLGFACGLKILLFGFRADEGSRLLAPEGCRLRVSGVEGAERRGLRVCGIPLPTHWHEWEDDCWLGRQNGKDEGEGERRSRGE